MAKYSEISVKGSAEGVQDLVRRAFGINGFNVNMMGATKGRAEKGSKGANVFLGAAATHHVVDFEILQTSAGSTLRLTKTGSGASGGLLGMRSANKQFEKMTDTLASWFKDQGVLLDVRKF